MKYNPRIVTAFLASLGLPAPVFEHVFAPPRRWRFDLAWPAQLLAVEVQGGIWTHGRHNRGAAMLKEWEKLNTAATLGWRIVYCQPQDLCLTLTAEMLKRALYPGGTPHVNGPDAPPRKSPPGGFRPSR